MHDLEPKAMGLRRGPFLDKSKRQSPVSLRVAKALRDSSSSAGCMRIQPIPSALQSVLRKVGRSGLNRAKIGEDVIHLLRSSNSSMSVGDQAIIGIGLR